MRFLPDNYYRNIANKKIMTYLFLSSCGCPVLKSVVLDKSDPLDRKQILQIQDHLGSTKCLVRYQYTRANRKPIRGGHLCPIRTNDLKKNFHEDIILWLLEPTSRQTNLYGINIYINKLNHTMKLEIVGRGFDVSNLNRGIIHPHQIIWGSIPTNFGWNNEWWKYINNDICKDETFQKSKVVRYNELISMGLSCKFDTFDIVYNPLPYDIIEQIFFYSNKIYKEFMDSDDFVISCSVLQNSNLVFWDIQTPQDKIKILYTS